MIGIATGVIAFLLLVIVAILYYYKKQQQKWIAEAKIQLLDSLRRLYSGKIKI